MASSSTLFKSAEEHRRQRELEEARKAGLAPAAIDEETGKEINPHIPQYMTTAPWYLNSDKPTLKHQKDWRQKMEDSKQWYQRGTKVFQATKWRKGACENCGSMTHKTKDCLERPRTVGAKYTNKHIAADELVQDIDLKSFDAKRDRWNGYDADAYKKVVDRYEQLEQLREETRKQQELSKRFERTASGEQADEEAQQPVELTNEDLIDDEDKIADAEEAGFAKVEKRVRTTAGGATGSVRNLRIREDTAKYLLNLDANSAHYDPKSRSMREDPTPWKHASEKTFAGDNFTRQTGDYHAWKALNLHAVTAYEGGQEIHNMAEPSAAALLFQQQQARKAAVAAKTKVKVLDQYGNAAEPKPDDMAALAQTEAYVEYDQSGRVIKGQEVKATSRYPEDVYINNHTSIWGSWWHDGVWGYACCHQTVKNSYCTGKAGEEAAAATAQQMLDNLAARQRDSAAKQQAEQDTQEGDRQNGAAAAAAALQQQKELWGEAAADVAVDEEKLKAAIERQKQEVAERAAGDERKRKYNSLAADTAVTVEDMEAYRLSKQRGDDPLAAFKKDGATDGYDYV